MNQARDDASDFAEMERIGREIEDHAAAKLALEEKIRRLRNAEDLAGGVTYAREIFEAQQDRLRLEVEIDLGRKKINRLRLAQSDGPLQ